MAPQDETQLRDWFAGLAMQSTGATHELTETAKTLHKTRNVPRDTAREFVATEIAKTAYVLADAMLKVRMMDQETLQSQSEAPKGGDPV